MRTFREGQKSCLAKAGQELAADRPIIQHELPLATWTSWLWGCQRVADATSSSQWDPRPLNAMTTCSRDSHTCARAAGTYLVGWPWRAGALQHPPSRPGACPSGCFRGSRAPRCGVGVAVCAVAGVGPRQGPPRELTQPVSSPLFCMCAQKPACLTAKFVLLGLVTRLRLSVAL